MSQAAVVRRSTYSRAVLLYSCQIRQIKDFYVSTEVPSHLRIKRFHTP